MLKPGTRIGSYEITSTLGEGGMGVVFRARDASLQRDVALKLLPDRFTSDSERLVRFRREAQILASLNHPNIAQVYGLEQSGNSNCIVMELVEGETLADRIRRGPIPLDEALDIARQVVSALDAAHEKGVVHRDLKPANIKRTPDGKVKVLDFGLAKSSAGESPQPDLSQSPTMTTASAPGVILGTAAYMAPEQARGRAVDKRADIWAFGCLLYEMLAGVRPFDGDDVTEILGATIHKEPEWDRLPERARPLVRRCLEKDPTRRLRDIGDAMSLVDLQAGTTTQTQRPSLLGRLGWPAAALFALVAIGVSLVHFLQEPPPPGLITFEIPPPPDVELDAINVVISPNGRQLAFAAHGKDNLTRIWIRNVDSAQARPLAGTEGIGALTWSPDSLFLAFAVGNQLKKVEVASGAVVTLATSATPVGSSSWSKDNIILFGGRGSGALQQVPASGGVPQAVTTTPGPFHSFPSFLPDGRHFLYEMTGPAEASGVYIGSLDVKPDQQQNSRLLQGTSNAMYVPGADPAIGHVLYTRNSTLMAHAFDANALQFQGEAVPVAEQVASPNAVLSIFSLSTNGVLAYRSGGGTARTVVLRDRNGQDKAITPNPADVRNPRLSPDGKRLAIVVDSDLWVYDLEGRPPIKLTFGRNAFTPLWTRDGKRLFFETGTKSEARDTSGQPVKVAEGSLLSIAADGSDPMPEPVSPLGHFHAEGWSLSGELIVTDMENRDVAKFLPNPKAQVIPVVKTPATEAVNGLSLSSDGRWLAYVSNATGADEIWVKAFTEAGAPIRVSPAGGIDPLWAKSGRELFYIQGNRLVSMEVDTRSGFAFKPPIPLFDAPALPGQQPPSYDVTADGRFIVLRSSNSVSTPVTVVINWTSKLKK